MVVVRFVGITEGQVRRVFKPVGVVTIMYNILYALLRVLWDPEAGRSVSKIRVFHLNRSRGNMHDAFRETEIGAVGNRNRRSEQIKELTSHIQPLTQ